MEENPGLAKNALEPSVNGKNKKTELWRKLCNTLNANGPPERSISGWQKVWRDYKYNAKRKLRVNKISQKQTGGGPSKKCYISPLEETAITAAGLEAEVSGLHNTKTFGAPSASVDNRIEAMLSEWESENPSEEAIENYELINENKARIVEGNMSSNNKENENNNATFKNEASQQINLIKEELTENKDFHNKLLEAINERNTLESEKLRLEREKFLFDREKHRDELKYRAQMLELKIKKIEVMQSRLD